jgi:hypothetical protein
MPDRAVEQEIKPAWKGAPALRLERRSAVVMM